MAQVGLDTAQLVAVVLETVLYGVFLVLYIGAIYVLVNRRPTSSGAGGKRELNWTMLITANVLFLLASGHWILSLARAFEAFIRFRKAPGGPVAYYEELNNPKSVASNALYILQTLAGDVFMIYRLYLVWGRNYSITIVPAMMTGVMLTGGLGTVYYSSRVGPGASSIFFSSTKKFLTAAFSGTLAMNVLCTALIAYRIWANTRRLKPYTHGRLYAVPVIEIVVESALVLCCCIIATMVAYVMGSNVQFVGVGISVPTIGITWTLIIVRVGMGVNSARTQGSTIPRQSYPLSPVAPVAIRVSRQTESDYVAPRAPHFDSKSDFGIPPMPSTDFVLRDSDEDYVAQSKESSQHSHHV